MKLTNQLVLTEQELRNELDRLFPPPATGSRGQGGLPVTGSVVDYSMYYTKDGKKYIYEQLLALIQSQKQAHADMVIGDIKIPSTETDALFAMKYQGSYDNDTVIFTLEKIHSSQRERNKL